MSQGRGDIKRKRTEQPDISLSHVVMFLRVITVMTGALFVVSTLFFLLFEKTVETNVVWGMTIGVNLAAAAGAFVAAYFLDKKDQELTKKEIERKQI